MRCPHCELEWTPPPDVCPKCRTTVAAASPAPSTTLPPTPVLPPTPSSSAILAGLLPISVHCADDLNATNIPQLKQAASMFGYTGTTNAIYLGSLLFGVIATLMGISGIQNSPLNIILMLLGIGLICEAFWVKNTPVSRNTFIVDGIVLLCIGLWNIIVCMMNSTAQHQTSAFLILGALQIFWGVQRFRLASTFTVMPAPVGQDEAVIQLTALVRRVRDNKPGTDPGIVEFQAQTSSYKVALGQEYHLIYEQKSGTVSFAVRSQFAITCNNPGEYTCAISVTMDGQTNRGKMPRAAYDRYQEWLAQHPSPTTAAMP